MKTPLTYSIGLVLAVLVHAAATPDDQNGSLPHESTIKGTIAAAASDLAARPIVHDGETFALANSTTAKNVETDEYTTAGEKLSAWTQLVTVQRVTTAKPSSATAFVAYFKQRVAEDGASLEVLSESKNASVFAVRFPRCDRNDEQVMICLAFRDAVTPERMNIIQYALKPTQCPLDAAASRIRSWRDKFLGQARGLAPTPE